MDKWTAPETGRHLENCRKLKHGLWGLTTLLIYPVYAACAFLQMHVQSCASRLLNAHTYQSRREARWCKIKHLKNTFMKDR